MESKEQALKWEIILDTGPVIVTGILARIERDYLLIVDEDGYHAVFATNRPFTIQQIK